MTKRCADCGNWDYTKGNFGYCRFNAPQPAVVKGSANDEYILVWPSTGRDDWCERGFRPVRSLEAVK